MYYIRSATPSGSEIVRVHMSYRAVPLRGQANLSQLPLKSP
jgi:hypothetical protein